MRNQTWCSIQGALLNPATYSDIPEGKKRVFKNTLGI